MSNNLHNEFDSKTILITGGSRGIGKGITLKLLKLGAKVVSISSTTELSQNEVAKYINRKDQLVQIKADLQLIHNNKNFESFISDYLPKIDILINNAGIKIRNNFLTSSIDEWNKTIAINLQAPFFLSQMVSKHMIIKRAGIIINIASQAGMCPVSSSVEYGLSKNGIIYLTKSMAKILAPYGIRVNAVSPGRTYTDQTNYPNDPEKEKLARSNIPLGVINQPEDVAEVVLFLLSKHASNITGQIVGVDGGECIV